jgi:hypothetical protein
MIICSPLYLASCSFAPRRRFRADIAPLAFNLACSFTISAHFRYQIDGAPIIRSSFHPRSKCNRQRHFDFRRPRGTKIPNFCALTPHAILFYSRAKNSSHTASALANPRPVSQCRKKVPWSASGQKLTMFKTTVFFVGAMRASCVHRAVWCAYFRCLVPGPTKSSRVSGGQC